MLALEAIVESLSQHMELEQTVSTIVNKSFEIIGKSASCFLFLVDKEKQNLTLSGSKYIINAGNLKSKNGDIFDNWVFKQRQPLLIEDIKKDFRFDAAKIENKGRIFNSLISVPLLSGNKIVGI